jgi:hypothetical protein
VDQGFEIAYPLRDGDWRVRRFMLREPSSTIVNVLSIVRPERLPDNHAASRSLGS